MKRKFPKILDVAIHSINLILINYALSNMMAFFSEQPPLHFVFHL